VIAHMILSGAQFEQPASQNTLMANPNPFGEEIDVVIFSSSNMTVQLSLVDNSGKVHWLKENMELKNGYNYLLVSELGKLAAGVYFLRVGSDSWSDTVKLLKN